MIRRALAVLGLVTVAVLFGSTAYAQTYNTGVLGGSTTTPTPGQTITVTGSGCPANGAVAFAIDGAPAGSTTADSNGSFTGTVTAPTTSGTHNVTATCGARVLGLEITVAPAAAALPRTGSSSTLPMSSIALALLASGGLLVLVSRRRRLANQPV